MKSSVDTSVCSAINTSVGPSWPYVGPAILDSALSFPFDIAPREIFILAFIEGEVTGINTSPGTIGGNMDSVDSSTAAWA